MNDCNNIENMTEQEIRYNRIDRRGSNLSSSNSSVQFLMDTEKQQNEIQWKTSPDRNWNHRNHNNCCGDYSRSSPKRG